MPPTVKPSQQPETRATRRKARTRQALLRAARRLCAEAGYQNLTVAAIAEAADVGIGTFYYHFQTKEDVLAALMDDFLSRVADRVAENRARLSDPIARLRAGLRVFFELSGEEQDLMRVYYSSVGDRAQFAARAHRFFLNDTMDVIRRGQAAGAIRAGDAELLAYWMFGGTTEMVQWWIAHARPLDEAAADLLADLMLDGLTTGGSAAE